MKEGTVVQSIGAVGDAIGPRAARQLELAFRSMLHGAGAEQQEHFVRVITGEPHPLGNFAIVNDPVDIGITQTAIGPLLDSGFPAAVLYTEGVTDAVAQAAVALGFENSGSMPAMAVDIQHMAATALPSGYEWARIGTGNDGRAWARALADGYEIPLGVANLFSPGNLGADMSVGAQTQFFAIHRDGRLVATSLLYLADGLAGIYCVATLKEERGKGLGAHATAEALRAAQELGYRVGVLQSSAAGHSVYLGLGFKDLGNVPMFVRMPS